MPKLILSIAAPLLVGCTSTGQWRDLRIDGSSEATFDESLSFMYDELSYSRRQMFQLALVDIVRTQVENSEKSIDGSQSVYTYDDYRQQLHGLSYEDVIALADQTGPSIRNVYYSGAERPDPWNGRAWPQTVQQPDPDRFRSQPVMPDRP